MKAWKGLPQGFCVAHTNELSVNLFLKEPMIQACVKKLKARTRWLHQCHAGMEHLHELQERLGLPQTKPQSTGNSTRWHFTHDMFHWYQEQQEAIIMLDVMFERRDSDTFNTVKITMVDWDIIRQSCGVLNLPADITHNLEGNQYVTIFLILPLMGKWIA